MHTSQLFNELADFCEKHPEMLFWGAQLAWMKEKYDGRFSGLFVEKEGVLYDTKEWTGEDSPLVLFKDKKL